MEKIQVLEKEIEIKEYRGVRVVTVWDIAELHNKEVREINQQFKRNFVRFEEGVDYFIVTHKEFLEIFKCFQKFIPNNVKNIALFAANGYLKLIRSFNEKIDYIKLNNIYKLLGGYDNPNLYISNSRFEIMFKEILFEVFDSLDLDIVTQYKVDKYRVDFYIPKFNVVVEYDEEGHKYKHKKDKEREEEIKSILKCTFIRCDYRISDIKNVMIILKHLFNFNVKEKDNEKM